LAENLSCKSVEMLDATVETIKKLTGANVEHAALIANSKILTLFSRFVGSILCFFKRWSQSDLFLVNICILNLI